VLVDVLAPALGARLLLAPVLETAPALALAPVAPLVPAAPVELVLPLAEQAALVVPPAAAELTDDGLAETDETGDALAAVDVTGLALAAVLAPLMGPVLGGAPDEAFPPHAASTSDTAASKGRKGLGVIDSSALACQSRP
jgi:hypothetical protein